MASTEWKETQAPDEAARFELYAKRMVALQQRQGGKLRALHGKNHGIYEARFEVHDNLPEAARHGLFAKPASYEALVRFSNGAGRVQADKVGDVRGIGVKVLGVPGAKVLGDATTQDFLAILTSATPFKNPDEFVAVVWAIRNRALALPRLIGALGPIRPFQLLPKLVAGMKGAPASLATKRFFSAVPIQCGPHAVRFSFTPAKDVATSSLSESHDFFTDDLVTRLAAGPLVYEMSLQFYVDEATTPIENASVDWPSPYIDVGKLVIAKQDARSERGRRLGERGDKLAFDPWHALVEHKPLGAMMRARKVAYFASETQRGVAPEPASLADLVA
jgi:hypothetical protein